MIERSNPEEMDELQAEISQKMQREVTASGSRAGVQRPGMWSKNTRITFVIAILVLTSSASFGLGFLTGQTGGSASSGHGLIVGSIPTVTQPAAVLDASQIGSTAIGSSSSSSATLGSIPVGGEVVGAKSTHSYYLPWCSQASTITNTDKVWFTSAQAAISQGYTAGTGCAGN